jgi:hypothetical protein
MIIMLLKEEIINCSIRYIGDSRGTSLSKQVLVALLTSKANLRDVKLWVLSLHFLNEGGIQFDSCRKVITQRWAGRHLCLADI